MTKHVFFPIEIDYVLFENKEVLLKNTALPFACP